MGRYKKLISITALLVMIAGLTIVASAQRRNRGNNDNYGNGRNNNIQLDSAVRNLKNSSRRFEDVLDRELDRSRYDGSNREDNLNRTAERFKNAADKLENKYDGYRNMRKSADEARQVITYGSQLDTALTRSRLTRNSSALQNQWNNIERDLQTIARAYNLNYNRQYGRNNGRYDNDNGRDDRNRNNRNNRNNRRGNGRYGNNGNLRSTIVSLRNKSRQFENQIDRVDDDRNGRRNSNNLENVANRFNDAVKQLEDEYNNGRDYDDSYDEVQRVLSIGQQLDSEISRSGLDRNLRSDWNNIEQDLRTIASAYNLSYNGNSNRNNRARDIIRNFPF